MGAAFSFFVFRPDGVLVVISTFPYVLNDTWDSRHIVDIWLFTKIFAAESKRFRCRMLLPHLRLAIASCTRIERVFNRCRNLCTSPDELSVRFRLIGSGACGDSSSFYLHARNARCVQKSVCLTRYSIIYFDCRYIFNCGEGVARLAAANGIRLATVQNVFFTQTKWHQLGGLGSLLRMIWEQRKDRIDVHGSRPLRAITKRIMAALNFPSDWNICKFNETTGEYEDSAIRIKFIPLRSNGAQPSENDLQSNELMRVY